MDFLSFVIRELLTFECAVSNRSLPEPSIKKFCLVRIGLKLREAIVMQRVFFVCF